MTPQPKRRRHHATRNARSEQVQTDLKKIGRRVHYYRETAGITIEELADRVKMHAGSVGRLEEGQLDTHVSVICRIARALGVETPRLFE